MPHPISNSQRSILTKSNVVVIGAAVVGIPAALDIAAPGIHVDLIEREPTIGFRPVIVNTAP